MKRTLFIFLLGSCFSIAASQHVHRVYPRSCITGLVMTERTRLDVPVREDGMLDLGKARLMGVEVRYVGGCKEMSYEIEKEKK